MDLSTISVQELHRLQSRIETEIQRRNDATRRNFLKKMQKMAAEDGLSLSEVLGDIAQIDSREQPATRKRRGRGKSTDKKTGKLPPKYFHPEQPGVGWSGHGRRPQWLMDWVGAGKPLEALEKPPTD